MKLNLKAFTLAEVLITLGIIGIVAAMTIPTLMNNIGDAQYKTAYKKAYSVATQAWQKALNDNNIVARTGWGDASAKVTNFNAFKSYFNVATDCTSNNTQCWAMSTNDEYYANQPSTTATLAFTDTSGMSWSLTDNGGATGSEILVDTNGLKKPNKYGQDRFVLIPSINGSATTLAGLANGILPPGECLSTSNCYASYTLVCPSVASHPCYFKTWLMSN